jgi:hypothetical protein
MLLEHFRLLADLEGRRRQHIAAGRAASFAGLDFMLGFIKPR